MKRIIAVAICLCMIISLVIVSNAEGENCTQYEYSIDSLYIDGKDTGYGGNRRGTDMYIYDVHFEVAEWISIGGWLANDEGLAKLQFSVDDGETWIDTDDASFTSRGDLEGAGVPYVAGHGTAGISGGKNRIPASKLPDEADILVRAVTLSGNYIVFLEFTDIEVIEPEDPGEIELSYTFFFDNITGGDATSKAMVDTSYPTSISINEGDLIEIRGWVLSNKGVSKLVYIIDGDEYDPEDNYTARKDALGVYATYTEEMGNTDHCGFGNASSHMKLPETSNMKAGEHTLEIFVFSADGNDAFQILDANVYVKGTGASNPTPSPEVTAAPEVTPTTAPTDAPAAETKAPETTAEPTTAPSPAPANTGCGGILSVSAIFMLLPACYLLKKKH